MKRTPLRKTYGLNYISPMRIHQLNDEVPARQALCKRAGGNPVVITKTIKFKNGGTAILHTVKCVGGYCELCKNPANGHELHPHEDFLRSRGGKVSLLNSKMVHNFCHPKSEVKLEWIK